MRRTLLSVLAIAAVAGSISTTASAQAIANMQSAASGLDRPVEARTVPGRPGVFFVLESHTGRIRVVENGTVLPTPALDIRNLMFQNLDSEQGLLGIAFDPDFETNRYVYINYTEPRGSTFVNQQGVLLDRGRTVIARYTVSSSNPNIIDPGSVLRVLAYDQPFQNHNGGSMLFGPDGYLYIASGDGGSAFDPFNNAADTDVLLGKLLRIDPSGDDFPADPSRNYAIPATNPFASGGGAPEIFHYGLRNPWRFSFDRLTGDLYIADVGQNVWEEINFVPAGTPGGLHFGWRCFEADQCLAATSRPECVGCSEAGLVFPIETYPHGTGAYSGFSITGGYVYRGSEIPRWRGRYFYTDFLSNRVWSIRVVNGEAVDFQNHGTDLRPGGLPSAWAGPVSFAEDEAGELYLVVFNGGTGNGGGLIKIVPEFEPGDWNRDGAVDASDVTGFLTDWFSSRSANTYLAEFNGDNTVDASDITSFLSAWFAGRG